MTLRSVRAWLHRATTLVGGMRADAELSAELRAHLDAHIDDNLRAGMASAEARRTALLALGGIAQLEESCREQRRLPLLEKTMQDLKFALRLLRKSPGHTAVAIVVLALGVGANAAVFSLVNAVVLRPLPFAESDHIMRVWHTPPPTFAAAPNGRRVFALSPANLLDWQAQNHIFDRMALYRFGRYSLTGQGEPESLTASIVTDDFFPILGIRPLAGRTLGAADSSPAAARAVMLSERIWQSRFGADPAAVGRSISLNSEPYVIAGIVPQRLALPDIADLWMPLVWTPQERMVRSNHTY
jgi:hypothetical protein